MTKQTIREYIETSASNQRYIDAMTSIVEKLRELQKPTTFAEAMQKQKLWQAIGKQVKAWVEDTGIIDPEDIDMKRQVITTIEGMRAKGMIK